MRYSIAIACLLFAACYNNDYLRPPTVISGSLIIGDSIYRVRIDTADKDTMADYTIGHLPQCEKEITPDHYSFSPYLGDDSTARHWCRKHGFKTFIALASYTSRSRLYYRYIAPGDSFRIIDISAAQQTIYKLSDPHRHGWTLITGTKGGSWINGDCYLPSDDIFFNGNWVIASDSD